MIECIDHFIYLRSFIYPDGLVSYKFSDWIHRTHIEFTDLRCLWMKHLSINEMSSVLLDSPLYFNFVNAKLDLKK